MSNPFRNEMMIELGEAKVLLRPTFENTAAMEAYVAPIPVIAFKIANASSGKAANSIAMTDLAKIVFYQQAEKTLTLEQIWGMIQKIGIGEAMRAVVPFIGKITAGDKMSPELSDEAKKNS